MPDLASARASEESAKTAVIGCLSTRGSANRELLVKASAAAGEHGGEFYAILVDSPHISFRKAHVRTLIDDVILADHLGAKIVWLESSNTVGDLLKFARQCRAARIFVLRSRLGLFSRLFGCSDYSNLLSRAEGFRIDVIGFEHGN